MPTNLYFLACIALYYPQRNSLLSTPPRIDLGRNGEVSKGRTNTKSYLSRQ